ncbi:MAG: efflux RND transporter periplasmic adaptor subunit [Thermodesulfobacteriota bacterium]
MKRKLAVVIFALIFAISAGLAWFFLNSEENGLPEVSGIAEATEVEISSKLGSRIAWLCCEEGERVKSNDVAIRLDDAELKAIRGEAEAAIRQAESAVEAAKSEIEGAKAGIVSSWASLKEVEAEIKKADILKKDAEKDLARTKELFKEGVLTEKELDTITTRRDTLGAEENALRARQDSLKAALAVARSKLKTTEAGLASALARLDEANAALNLADANLKDTVIIFPMDGIIAHKAFQTGEVVSPGVSIYTVHDVDNLWVRIDVDETLVAGIKLGAKAVITHAGFLGKAFEGTAVEIGAAGGFATQRDVTRGRSDIRTFRVKMKVRENKGELKPGMTVKVRFL